jgi:hypothetical protein
MTVKQLKKHLETQPDSLEVYLGERTTDFGYAPLETVEVRVIPFQEEPSGKALSRDTVLILSEECRW